MNRATAVQLLQGELRGPLGAVVGLLTKQGLHVDTSDCSIRAYRRFKNGTPQKTPRLELYFEENVELDVWDDESGEVATTALGPRQRPWVVRKFGTPARTFKRLDDAIRRFAEWAHDI